MHITTLQEIRAKTSDAWRAEKPVVDFFRRVSITLSLVSSAIAALTFWLG